MESERLFAEAETLMPGGVSSPVRAIRPYPFYTERAAGARLRTVDGAELVDCCMAYGPLILGHAHPSVRSAIERQLEKGWLYGTPTPGELELARLILADHPACERIRFVSTGAEATMAAIRAARGYTGKQAIVKVEGGFHGAHDAVLVRAGSGATTMGVPDSAGVPPVVAAMTLQVAYNDPEALEALLARREDVAAMILEPVMGNVGLVLPEENYLAEVRRITEEHGVLLIFDEVITGYRIGIGGAQRRYGIRPDMTTFGKVIGGGLPIGAFAGRREIMQLVAPAGPVYQAGTYSGNPLSLAAGAAAIGYLHAHPECYRLMEENVRAIGDATGGTGSFVRLGSCFTYFFRSAPPRNYIEAKESDTDAFRAFWERMLARGVFLPPSQFETCFLSAAHTLSDIERVSGGFQTCR